MKIEGNGQAKILTSQEIQILFTEGLKNPRDRAVFGICLYTACCISEACSLRVVDVYNRKGVVRDCLVIRKKNTKGKLSTRTLPIINELQTLLVNYYPSPRGYWLFPGRHNKGHLNPYSAGNILKDACNVLEIEGVSTHSFRRTALTQMSNAGIPLRVIQEISGHRSLEVLQSYLEVTDEQIRGAASSLSMLGYTPVQDNLTTSDTFSSESNEVREDENHIRRELK